MSHFILEDEVGSRSDSISSPLILSSGVNVEARTGGTLTKLLGLFFGNGVACGLGAAFFLSWANLCAKLVHAPPFQVLFVEGVGCFLVLLGISKCVNCPLGSSKLREWPLLVCMALLQGLFLGSQFTSMFKITISDTITIRSISTAISALLLWVVKREPLGWATVSGVVSCFAGVVFVVQPKVIFGGSSTEWTDDWTWGVVWAFLAAVFLALISLVVRLIGKGVHPVTVQLWTEIGLIVVPLIPLSIGWPEQVRWDMFASLRDMLMVLAAISTVLFGGILYIRSVQLLFAAFANALLSLLILFVAIWEFLILDASFTYLSVIGSFLMIIGLFIVSLDSKGSRSNYLLTDKSPPSEDESRDSADLPGAQFRPPVVEAA